METKKKIRKDAELLVIRPKPGAVERDQIWNSNYHVLHNFVYLYNNYKEVSRKEQKKLKNHIDAGKKLKTNTNA